MLRPTLLALVAIVPLTFGLRTAGNGERHPDYARLTADAAQALAADGWSVQPIASQAVGQLISASKGGCRILVNFPSHEGQSDEKFRYLARGIGPVSYQYRGTVSSQLPRFAPLLAKHAQRYAWSFGVTIPTAPPITLARSPACGGQTPDFSAIRQHLQAPSRAS